MPKNLSLTAIENIPEVIPGDSIVDIIINGCTAMNWQWDTGDIILIAQKIISKSEGRLVNLKNVLPSDLALNYARSTEKDPRVVELILGESKKVLRTRPGLMVVEHRLGFICANAGIDQSNVKQDSGETVLLLPEDPDRSANQIREALFTRTGKDVGVIITDSHGRPWRKGITGISIGISGVPGVVDCRGTDDLFGYKLRVTEIGAADELAAAGSILMGQGSEGRPIVLVKGFPYELRKSSIKEVIRAENEDLFR